MGSLLDCKSGRKDLKCDKQEEEGEEIFHTENNLKKTLDKHTVLENHPEKPLD